MIYRNNIFLSVSFIGLISLGLVMVTSSSIYIADNLTGNPFHFATRQALFIGIGILVFTIFLSPNIICFFPDNHRRKKFGNFSIKLIMNTSWYIVI